MSTLIEIRSAIIDALNDDSISGHVIDKHINAGYKFIAKRVLLPDLETSGVFTTKVGLYQVDIPKDWAFGRNLYNAACLDKSDIEILNSTLLLRAKYPDFNVEFRKGNIEFITQRGSSLLYYPIPVSETVVSCNFYKAPDPLVDEDDEPTALPAADQEDLLVYYALWKLWAQIEDGITGSKVNTTYNRGEFFALFNTLDDDIEVGQSQVDIMRGSSWI